MKSYKFLLPFISYLFFIILWVTLGYFSIGAITDTYSDIFSALNSTLWEKFTNTTPYIDIYRYRPLLFVFLQVVTSLSLALGFSLHSFWLLKVVMLILLFLIGFLSYCIVIKLTNNHRKASYVFFLVIAYPNTLHSLFWTAGISELLLTSLFLLAVLFKIYFFQTQKTKHYILSAIFLILSLFTKETALVYPFVVLFLLRINFSKEFLAKHQWSFISDFLILILFVIFRSVVMFSKSGSVFFANIGLFTFYSFINFLEVFFKAVFSIIFPFDYLEFIQRILTFDLYIITYIIVVFLLFTFLYKNNKKALLLSGIVFLLSISPFLYAGYIRPQLILLPFCLLMITLGTQLIKIPRSLVAIVLIFWISEGIVVEHYWKFAYNEAQKNIDLLSTIDTSDKTIVLIGIPSRLQQYHIANNIMFPLNLKKYNQYIIRDTIIDNPQIVYISAEAVNKEITIMRKNNNSFVLLCTNPYQFFYFPEENKYNQEVIENEFFKVTVIKRNLYLKPSQILLETKKQNVEYYLLQPNRIVNFKEL